MLTLVIGNKNYSSWSLRPWLLLTEAGIAFDEIRLSLFMPTFRSQIAQYSPTGRVPVLIDGPLKVWDTLAIAEYVAERFPERGLWPAGVDERARARSICAEMHAGFSTLRNAMPMNVAASLPGMGWSIAVQDDIDRLVALWRECLEGSGGPMLFGAFGIADAFFAPVISRLSTYAVALPPDIAAYCDRVLALDGMRAWSAAAAAETEFLREDEPYRRAR